MRNNLPERRAARIIQFSACKTEWTARLGYQPDGTLAEVFLSAGKSGTEMAAIARDSAIILSFALQHGAGLDGIRSALTRNESGLAEGPVGVLLDILGEDGEGPELTSEPTPAPPPAPVEGDASVEAPA